MSPPWSDPQVAGRVQSLHVSVGKRRRGALEFRLACFFTSQLLVAMGGILSFFFPWEDTGPDNREETEVKQVDGKQGCISCGILLSGTGARGVSSEHMENVEMFSENCALKEKSKLTFVDV